LKDFFNREKRRYRKRKNKQKLQYNETKKKDDRIIEQKKQIDGLQDQLFKANSLLENINHEAVSTYQKSVTDNENMKKLLQEKIQKIGEYEILIQKGITNLHHTNEINQKLKTRLSNTTNEINTLKTNINKLTERNTDLVDAIKHLKKKISDFNKQSSNKIII